MFFSEARFLLTLYVMALYETKMKGICFYLGARTQGKIDTLHRKGLKSPPHTT